MADEPQSPAPQILGDAIIHRAGDPGIPVPDPNALGNWTPDMKATFDAEESRRQAGVTPRCVLKGLRELSGSANINGIPIAAMSLQHQWLLEDIESPLVAASLGKKGGKITTQDLCRAFLIMHDVDWAEQLFQEGMPALDKEARKMGKALNVEGINILVTQILGPSKVVPGDGGDDSGDPQKGPEKAAEASPGTPGPSASSSTSPSSAT